MRTVIPVENKDTLAAVRGFLKRLLEANVVDALLVPMETPADTITPALVSNPDLLDAANPLAPVMGLNAARVAGRVSIREPRGRIGVVLRPCELRALVELVKLQQASLDDMVTIGVDCLGTYDVAVYTAMHANPLTGLRAQSSRSGQAAVDMAAMLAQAQNGELAPQEGALQKGCTFRDGCQMCEKPHAEGADLTLELFGADLTTGIPISLPNEIFEKLSPPHYPPTGGLEGGERRADVGE